MTTRACETHRTRGWCVALSPLSTANGRARGILEHFSRPSTPLIANCRGRSARGTPQGSGAHQQHSLAEIVRNEHAVAEFRKMNHNMIFGQMPTATCSPVISRPPLNRSEPILRMSGRVDWYEFSESLRPLPNLSRRDYPKSSHTVGEITGLAVQRKPLASTPGLS